MDLVAHAESFGRPVTVTFGVPLPPGTVKDEAELALVSVLDGTTGEELPIFVKSAGKHPRMPPESMLCSGLSSAAVPGLSGIIIQLNRTFTSSAKTPLTVRFGQAPTKARIVEVDPRLGYRVVNDGSFLAASNVSEPLVYALLAPSLLACSLLSPNERPFTGGNLPVSAKDNVSRYFDSAINPATTPFRTTAEPWLYNRAQVFIGHYIRTGEIKYLREGVRATQFYNNNINSSGSFALKAGDSKYVYNENMHSGYMLTGDPALLAKINLTQSSQPAITRGAFFTERNFAMSLHAAVTRYLVSGAAADLNRITAAVDEIALAQDNPMFKAEAGDAVVARTGCLHYHVEEAPDELGFSPWMHSLLANALARAYVATAYDKIPTVITDFAKCINSRGLYSIQSGSATYPVPYYVAAAGGLPHVPTSAGADPGFEGDYEHAIDVAYLMALASYLTTDASLKSAFASTANRLFVTYRDVALPNAGSAASPPRKNGWWYKNGTQIDWLLNGKIASPLLGQ